MGKPRSKESQLILTEMLEAGLSVKEVAKGLNLSYPYLASIVYGRYNNQRVMEMALRYVRSVKEEEGDGLGKGSGNPRD